MHPHLVKCAFVGLVVVAVPVAIVRGQAPRPSGPALQLVAGPVFQNWPEFGSISPVGLAGGIGLEVPLRPLMFLRGDVGVVYFSSSLFSDTVVDCIGPCPGPTSISAVNAALDLVMCGPTSDRMYLIAGASGHRATEAVDRGHRDALGVDVGVGMNMSAHWHLETVMQKLTRPLGQTQWMLPIRVRLRL